MYGRGGYSWHSKYSIINVSHSHIVYIFTFIYIGAGLGKPLLGFYIFFKGLFQHETFTYNFRERENLVEVETFIWLDPVVTASVVSLFIRYWHSYVSIKINRSYRVNFQHSIISTDEILNELTSCILVFPGDDVSISSTSSLNSKKLNYNSFHNYNIS